MAIGWVRTRAMNYTRELYNCCIWLIEFIYSTRCHSYFLVRCAPFNHGQCKQIVLVCLVSMRDKEFLHKDFNSNGDSNFHIYFQNLKLNCHSKPFVMLPYDCYSNSHSQRCKCTISLEYTLCLFAFQAYRLYRISTLLTFSSAWTVFRFLFGLFIKLLVVCRQNRVLCGMRMVMSCKSIGTYCFQLCQPTTI